MCYTHTHVGAGMMCVLLSMGTARVPGCCVFGAVSGYPPLSGSLAAAPEADRDQAEENFKLISAAYLVWKGERN